METIDVTTTSVGRGILKITYESFFKHVIFDGLYDFHIAIDPAYGVSEEEIKMVLDYLESIKSYPKVNSVEVTRFDKAIGLEGALMILLSQCHNRYGINLEDDWRFFKDIELNNTIKDMQEQNSCMIAFASTHLENRGTFLQETGAEPISNTHTNLQRLIPPNWACDYIPLAPNLHDNYIWNTAYITGLMFDQNRERCPEERTKEYVRSHGLREKYNVLWTRDVVVEDIGRQWLAERDLNKRILPDENKFDEYIFEDASSYVFKGYCRSEKMYNRAIKTIPGQTQTFMKRGQAIFGKQPLYADKGYGCYFIDVDGNRYIDYVAGLGVLQLGYCHPAFTEAVRIHLNKGVYFSLPTWHEIEASELLNKIIPNAEMTRFLKSGGDACSAAVTLSRSITGRTDILSCGYHGWHEQFQPFQPGAYPALKSGIREFDINKNDIEEIISSNPDRYACIIIALPYKEIVNRETLLNIRRICDKYGILFVLDDIVTGFRLSLGGAQEYYNFDADIILLSKALTGGAELSAICGKSIYMKEFEKLYVSTTMGGEMTAIQCMINAVAVYQTTNIINRTHDLGRNLRSRINNISRNTYGQDILFGYDSMPYLDMGSEIKNDKMADELMQKGIYMRKGCNFVTGAHGQNDIDYTVDVFEKIIREGQLLVK